MKLGILVNTDSHLHDIIGISKAALGRGHEVVIFTMDRGTRLFEHPEYGELCSLSGITMSYCDHNAKMFQARTDDLSDVIVCGSQFDNAAMHHECDRVLIL